MNAFEVLWGEAENRVIDAMKIIKEYCEKQTTCNVCPMFDICTQIGGKKRWVIPNKAGEPCDK